MTKGMWAGAVWAAALCTAAVAVAAKTPARPGTSGPTPPPARFVDNGNGTVTDTRTKLMWERKTGKVGGAVDCLAKTCTDPHDVNNLYKWAPAGPEGNGGLFTDFLPRVNGTRCATDTCPGLGGHRDWRLPTIAELQELVDRTHGSCADRDGACIDPVFGPTVTAFYWASTQPTAQKALPTPGGSSTGGAWVVGFGAGDIGDGGAVDGPYVRAVRDAR